MPQSFDSVHALLFDVFGTVVDWHGSMVRHLERKAPFPEDWSALAIEWRAGYGRITGHVAKGGEGPSTVDEIHRQILDEMLASPRWSKLAPFWDDQTREELVLAWHNLDAWPDSTPGLVALKQRRTIGTLSNGNLRLLIDMAKHANLPWDVVLSSSLFSTYKPNHDVYNGAARLLTLQPHQVALVAAHIDDLEAARACGFRVVYVNRPTEDLRRDVDTSNIDLVVNDFGELARVLASSDHSVHAKM